MLIHCCSLIYSPKTQHDLLEVSTGSCHLLLKTLQGFPFRLKQYLTSFWSWPLSSSTNSLSCIALLTSYLCFSLLTFHSLRHPEFLTQALCPSSPTPALPMPDFFSSLKTCCAWLHLKEAFLVFSTEIRFPVHFNKTELTLYITLITAVNCVCL